MKRTVTDIRLPHTLTGAALAGIRETLDVLTDESVVILRRAGDEPVFCRGMDFTEFGGLADEQLLTGLRAFAAVLFRLREGNFVSIAAVDGHAVGGGVGLAAACDAVIATDRSRFGLPEALYGFSPAIVSVMLRDRMTRQGARLLGLRCDTIDAKTAERAGLADLVVPPEELEKAVRYEARRLGRPLPEGRRAVKHRFSGDPDLERTLEETVQLTWKRLRDPAVRERLQSIASDNL